MRLYIQISIVYRQVFKSRRFSLTCYLESLLTCFGAYPTKYSYSWHAIMNLNADIEHNALMFVIYSMYFCVCVLCLNYGRNAFAISVYIKVLWMLIRVHNTLLEVYLPQGIKSKYSWRRHEKWFNYFFSISVSTKCINISDHHEVFSL